MKPRRQDGSIDGRSACLVSHPKVINGASVGAEHGVASEFDEFHGGSLSGNAALPLNTATQRVDARLAVTDTVGKALFIPLKREYFEAFKAGAKQEEFRPEGARWNAHTCAVGRPVVLSLGYGKAQRLTGRVVGYRSSAEPTQTAPWKACYGDRTGLAACIRIQIDGEHHGR